MAEMNVTSGEEGTRPRDWKNRSAKTLYPCEAKRCLGLHAIGRSARHQNWEFPPRSVHEEIVALREFR